MSDSKSAELLAQARQVFVRSFASDFTLPVIAHAEGATITAIIKATGWQKHSVRGFFAGVVRKRLGLTLESDKSDGNRTYRIVTGGKPPEPQSKPEAKRRAP